MWSRSYAVYVLARFAGIFSTHLLLLVLGLALYDLTDNAFFLGIAGLMMFAPALALVFVTGLVVDRHDRKQVLAAAFALGAVGAGVLTWHQVERGPEVVPILLLFVLIGVVRAFYAPTLKSLLINIVPLAQVPRAIAFNTTTTKAAAVTGPVVGGLLYATGPVHALMAGTVGFAVAVVAALLIGPTSQKRVSTPLRLGDLVGGVRTILSHRLLFAAMMLDLVAVILGGATALLPVYGRDVLFIGPAEIGLLRAAPAAGTLLAALLLVWRPLHRHTGWVMLGAMSGYGVGILVFGLSTLYWLSFAALFFAGACDMISIFVREILIQLRTPDETRGRVNAINAVFNTGANEIGDFRAGTAAALIGAVPAVVIGGISSVGIAALWAWRYPELRRMDRV